MAPQTIRALSLTITFAGCLIATSVAQQTNPTFEAASIRRTAYPNLPIRDQKVEAGRFVAVHISASELIRYAYDVGKNQIEGGPAWVNDGLFDVNAKADGAVPEAQIRLMLRSVLRERFRLALRVEQREMRVYELLVDRSDGRLGPAIVQVADKDECDTARLKLEAKLAPGGTALTTAIIQDCGLDGFVKSAQARLNDGVVIDKTGLVGTWFVQVSFAPSQATDSNLPSFFTAIREQLGLRLRASRGLADVLVIDGIEQPSEN